VRLADELEALREAVDVFLEKMGDHVTGSPCPKTRAVRFAPNPSGLVRSYRRASCGNGLQRAHKGSKESSIPEGHELLA
jgi:hypothetical protein